MHRSHENFQAMSAQMSHFDSNQDQLSIFQMGRFRQLGSSYLYLFQKLVQCA